MSEDVYAYEFMYVCMYISTFSDFYESIYNIHVISDFFLFLLLSLTYPLEINKKGKEKAKTRKKEKKGGGKNPSKLGTN